MGGGGRTIKTEKGEEVPSEVEEGGPSSKEGELGETRLSKGEEEKT